MLWGLRGRSLVTPILLSVLTIAMRAVAPGAAAADPIYAPAPPPAQAAPAPPVSSAFSFGKPRLNRKRGTASLPVKVPGPGLLRWSVAAAGHGATSSSVSFIGAAGTVRIAIAASGQLQKRLYRSRKVEAKVTVVYTPNGGTAASRTRLLALVQRRP